MSRFQQIWENSLSNDDDLDLSGITIGRVLQEEDEEKQSFLGDDVEEILDDDLEFEDILDDISPPQVKESPFTPSAIAGLGLLGIGGALGIGFGVKAVQQLRKDKKKEELKKLKEKEEKLKKLQKSKKMNKCPKGKTNGKKCRRNI